MHFDARNNCSLRGAPPSQNMVSVDGIWLGHVKAQEKPKAVVRALAIIRVVTSNRKILVDFRGAAAVDQWVLCNTECSLHRRPRRTDH